VKINGQAATGRIFLMDDHAMLSRFIRSMTSEEHSRVLEIKREDFSGACSRQISRRVRFDLDFVDFVDFASSLAVSLPPQPKAGKCNFEPRHGNRLARIGAKSGTRNARYYFQTRRCAPFRENLRSKREEDAQATAVTDYKVRSLY